MENILIVALIRIGQLITKEEVMPHDTRKSPSKGLFRILLEGMMGFWLNFLLLLIVIIFIAIIAGLMKECGNQQDPTPPSAREQKTM